MKKINYVIVKPGGNDTAIVETSCDSKDYVFINAKILKKEKSCEQVVFIKGWDNNNTLIIEMAGGEFCGNAVRAVLRYLSDRYNIESCKIKYKGYKFCMIGKCFDKFSAFSIKKDNLIKDVERIAVGEYKVEFDGITQYVILESSDKIVNYKDKEKTKKFIFSNIKDEKSYGVVYLKNDLSLYPYVYVQGVDTMFFETACGTGTIACACVISKIFNKNNIDIKQPSGYCLKVKINKGQISLSGVAEIIKESFIYI